MAGDWIKVRHGILDDPSVILISSTTGLDPYAVVGRLIRLWTWADQHLSLSRSCHARGVTPNWIDSTVATPGFAQAMQQAGWLVIDADGISFPNFDRHMSQSAKDRALATNRQTKRRVPVTEMSRSDRDKSVTDVTEMSRSDRDKSVTREEKRKKESPLFSPPSGDQKNEPFDIDPSKPRLAAIWSRFLAHCATLKKKPTRESTELWIERLKAISEDLAVKTVESWIASGRYTPPAEWLQAACKTATGPPLRPVGAVKAPWQEGGHWLCQDAVGKCWWDGKKWVPIKGKSATTIQEFLDSAKAPAAVSVFEEG